MTSPTPSLPASIREALDEYATHLMNFGAVLVPPLSMALRMAKREGGANATMHVGDVLRLIEAFQSGSLDGAEVPVSGPFYPRGVQ
jgi:hypothetical protein